MIREKANLTEKLGRAVLMDAQVSPLGESRESGGGGLGELSSWFSQMELVRVAEKAVRQDAEQDLPWRAGRQKPERGCGRA